MDRATRERSVTFVLRSLACAATVAVSTGFAVPGTDFERGGDPGGMRPLDACQVNTWPTRRTPSLPVQMIGELQRRGEMGGPRVRRAARRTALGASVLGLGASVSLGASVQGLGASVAPPLLASVVGEWSSLPSCADAGLGASALPASVRLWPGTRTSWAPSALPATVALGDWWSWTREREPGGYWAALPEATGTGDTLSAFLSATDFAAPRR